LAWCVCLDNFQLKAELTAPLSRGANTPRRLHKYLYSLSTGARTYNPRKKSLLELLTILITYGSTKIPEPTESSGLPNPPFVFCSAFPILSSIILPIQRIHSVLFETWKMVQSKAIQRRVISWCCRAPKIEHKLYWKKTSNITPDRSQTNFGVEVPVEFQNLFEC
jgi:hypothetical protein